MVSNELSLYRDLFPDKRCLITGGLGFIGSNLARRLVGLGADVLLVDVLAPEYGGNLFNIRGIEDAVQVNVSDVRDHNSMAYLVQGQDILFNLAGQTSHLDSVTDPDTDLEINCRSQLSILEACRRFNPEITVVFASTRQLYGKPRYLPVDEEHPLHPVDVNGINKMAGEWYHILYYELHGIRSSALRLTNTYGPRMRVRDARQTFLGVWVRRLLQGEPIEVWGGEQLRDFTYVDDVIDGTRAAAANGRGGSVYNIGGGEPVELRTVVDMLGQLLEREVLVEHRPAARGDVDKTCADSSLAARELGVVPTTPLATGLAAEVEWMLETRRTVKPETPSIVVPAQLA